MVAAAAAVRSSSSRALVVLSSSSRSSLHGFVTAAKFHKKHNPGFQVEPQEFTI